MDATLDALGPGQRPGPASSPVCQRRTVIPPAQSATRNQAAASVMFLRI
jgi:hypothetical protein